MVVKEDLLETVSDLELTERVISTSGSVRLRSEIMTDRDSDQTGTARTLQNKTKTRQMINT